MVDKMAAEGCLDIVMPIHALEACQTLDPGQKLHLIGWSTKQAASMGSTFKHELSDHWRCEVTFVSKPIQEVPLTMPAESILDHMKSSIHLSEQFDPNSMESPNIFHRSNSAPDIPQEEIEERTYEILKEELEDAQDDNEVALSEGELSHLDEDSEGFIYEGFDTDDSECSFHGGDYDNGFSTAVVDDGSSRQEMSASVDIQCSTSQFNDFEPVEEEFNPNANKTEAKAISKQENKGKTCPTCGKVFVHMSKLCRHYQLHFSSKGTQKGKRRGKSSKKSDDSSGKLADSPKKERVLRSSQPYCCELCGDVLENGPKFWHHLHAHKLKNLTEEDKKCACSTCGKRYYLPSQLKVHEASHSVEKQFICSVCNRGYLSKASLGLHMKKHSETKPFTCPECGAGFYQKVTLSFHMITHTGEKPYRCDLCSDAFTQPSTLKDHRRIHTGERPYKCGKCGKTFRTRTALRQHSFTHTREVLFTCDICGKGFSRKKTMINHRYTHTGEKPYKCPICNKGFGNASHVIRHKRIHTGEKPYQCQQCGERFVQKECLKRHMRKHSTPEETMLNIFGVEHGHV